MIDRQDKNWFQTTASPNLDNSTENDFTHSDITYHDVVKPSGSHSFSKTQIRNKMNITSTVAFINIDASLYCKSRSLTKLSTRTCFFTMLSWNLPNTNIDEHRDVWMKFYRTFTIHLTLKQAALSCCCSV